jgi:phosphopantothenoylcysteine decarboxylase / phosphopantothenate---cysteine ligase
MSSSEKKMIVLGVTGSIAAYKAADLIRRFAESGWDVSVIMTKEAEKFISPTTLSALAGKKVATDMFDSSAENWPMGHLDYAQKAAAVVIAPATANIIAKLACGLADDLLSCTVLASQAPIFIAPAMNTAMYHNRITQENCRRLKDFGFRFIGPVSGKLACGVVGDGHLAEVNDIVETVNKNVLGK